MTTWHLRTDIHITHQLGARNETNVEQNASVYNFGDMADLERKKCSINLAHLGITCSQLRLLLESGKKIHNEIHGYDY